MKNFLVFVPLCLCLFITGYSQAPLGLEDFVPGTPEASALGKFISHPINYANGTVDVSVPLYEINERGIKIPVKLLYNTSGIKVQEVAGVVGLGWALQAGGSITRIIRDRPDEVPDGYFGSNDRLDDYIDIDELTIPGSVIAGIAGNWDGEADIFRLNLNGRFLSFFFDVQGQVHFQPYQDIKMDVDLLDDEIVGFTVWDENGTEYIFGSSEDYRESSKIEIYNDQLGEEELEYETEYYSTTWLLENIKTPSGRLVEFFYESGTDYYFDYFNKISEDYWSQTCAASCLDPFEAHYDYWTKQRNLIQEPKYLSEIRWGLGSVDFNYGSRTEILNYKKLENLEVVDRFGNTVNSINFGYSYFTTPYCNDNLLCKRLKLDYIKEHGYLKSHIFQYTDVSLPSRKTLAHDHWGYYNDYDQSAPFDPELARVASQHHSVAGSLIGIKYPGGGMMGLDYQLNEFAQDGEAILGGGLRIKALLKGAEENVLTALGTQSYESVLATEVIYNGGQSYGLPSYRLKVVEVQSAYPVTTTTTRNQLHSMSVRDLFDFNGVNVIYSAVTEIKGSLGKTVFEFYNYSDYSNDKPRFYEQTSFGDDSNMEEGEMDESLLKMSQTSYYWRRGLTKSKSIYDNQDRKITRTSYIYDWINVESLRIKNFISNAFYHSVLQASRKQLAIYDLICEPVHLKLETVETFDETGQILLNVNTTNYEYHSENQTNLSGTTTTLESGREEKVEYKYSFDICTSTPSTASSEAMGYCHMKNRHIIGTPVQTVQKYKAPSTGNYEIVGASFNTFHEIGSNIVPYHTYSLDIADPIAEGTLEEVWIDASASTASLEFDSRFDLKDTYNFYQSGNLSYHIDNEGIRTDYTWGDEYNNTLVTAKTINETLTTTYEHIPLVGVNRVTDPNGKSTAYEYDKFNRLRLVRDHNDNILERYRYHYKTEDINLNASIDIAGKNKTGISLDFTSQEIFSYGPTRYIWDFGDGVEVELTTPETEHTYSTAGDYTIRLTMINPEYETVEITRPYSVKSVDYIPEICAEYYVYSQCDQSFHGGGEGDACVAASEPYFLYTGSANDGAFCEGDLEVEWYYKLEGTFNTVFIGEGEQVDVPDALLTNLGGHIVICKVTDVCTYTYSKEIQFATFDYCVE